MQSKVSYLLDCYVLVSHISPSQQAGVGGIELLLVGWGRQRLGQRSVVGLVAMLLV